MAAVAPPRGANPFDDSGVSADTGGVRRCPGLHASLVEMFVAASTAPLPRNPNGKVLKGPLRGTGFGAPLVR